MADRRSMPGRIGGVHRHVLLMVLLLLVGAGLQAGPVSGAVVTVEGSTTSTPSPTLDTQFHSQLLPAQITAFDCTSAAGGTLSYTVSGDATGPYPGTFTETGTVTLGPEDIPIPGTTDQFRAAILAFEASFTITSSSGNVSGTKTMLEPSDYNYGGCNGLADGWSQNTAQVIASDLGYTATLPEGSTDTGDAWSNFNAYEQYSGSASSDQFRAGFRSSTPTPTDTTRPKLSPTVSPNPVQKGGTATADPGATDPESGIASSSCGPVDTSAVGTFTVTCMATNGAGLTASTTVSYEVTAPPPPTPVDSDGDGLWDVIEIWLGCDPHDSDTDDDGIGDYIEILLETDPTKSDSDPDDGEGSDGSWLLKIYGHQCGCGPEDDADGDGVSTWVELKWGSNPGDPDTDGAGGYSGDLELMWQLCGCKPIDQDGDGIPTMVEKYWGGGLLQIIHKCGCRPWEDPNQSGGIWIDFVLVGGTPGDWDDPDGDGLPTVIEIWLGCNPNDPDTDGDGLTDYREIFLGTDPLDDDTDGDGLTDHREIVLGCDPLDADTDGDGILDGADGAPLAYVDTCRVGVTDPVAVGIPVTATIGTTGKVAGAEVRWGDGTVSATAGAGTQSFTYAYDEAGVYLVNCAVTDETGGTQTTDGSYVVVYDPSAGFVTGGGWIDSPAGALVARPELAGPARFGFVSQYHKGAQIPVGNTEFQFQAGSVNFKSSSYDWLVVAGSRAQYKGVGTINGEGSYGFMLTAIDAGRTGDPDRFRMKIWEKDSGALVYDNQLGAADSATPSMAITQGSIVIHTKR